MRFVKLVFFCEFLFLLFLQGLAQQKQSSIQHALISDGNLSFNYSTDDAVNSIQENASVAETPSPIILLADVLVIANDDNAMTNEDTPVTIKVLSNDNEITGTIDPATVDLNTSLAGIQDENILISGTFKVDGSGEVTYTPAINYNGSATLNYTVDDNLALTSNEATITVTVTAVNDAPTITAQTPATISASEDTDFMLLISNLVIADPDNTTFTLSVLSGTNYTFTGTTITPTPNYNGPLTVNVLVSDGTANSVPFGVAVSVAAVNDAPTITSQTPATISATEDTNFVLSVSNLVISDPDNTTFTLTVLSGTNYSFTGTTITPAPNYNGPLTVNVQVSDGVASSASFGAVVSIAAVNDVPVITGQTPATISATEDTNFTLSVSNLVISDPDNTIFTLTVLSGTNYSFTGTTITPALNYNGALTVNVQVSDGSGNSAAFGVAFSVAAVNDAPAITEQTPATISATESTAFTLAVSNLIISDPDNTTFTITILAGTNYTFSGTTITPTTNYNGALTVNVSVSDGTASSATFGVAVSVAAVNNPPTITGQTPATISATEDVAFSLSVSNLVITDPDNATFTLTILTGTNYTFSGTTITPAPNYNGPLTVNVQVSDGAANSAPFGIAVSVAAVNDVPAITGQIPATISATESTAFTLAVSNLLITDPDNTTFTLTILAGTNYTFSGTTVTPTTNYNGALTVNVRVSDGSTNSTTFGVAVSVAAVNNPPIITSQTPTPVSATEDVSFALSISNLVINDPDNTTFTLTILAGTNYTFSGTTIIPSSNYNGTLTVNVQVNDGLANSAPFGVSVSVAAVNDAPTITSQTPTVISATESTAFTLSVSNLVISDPDNTVFTLTILSGTNYTFSGTTITPVANYNGSLTVNLKVSDGLASSSNFAVAVNVAAVNNVPQITGQTPISISEVQPITLQLSQLTVFDPDNSYPNDFTLSIIGGANYSVVGNVVTPVANFSGLLLVKVFVNDGLANSPNYNVQILVNSVNDSPVITGQQPLSTNEDSSIAIQLTDLIVTDPDNTFPTDFTLTILPGTGYTFLGNTITPPSNFNGNLLVSVKVNDGLSDSGPHNIQITINPVNDAPIITSQLPNPIMANENTPLPILLSSLIVTDIDNAFPGDFTINVSNGLNYTVNTTTITPNFDFFGLLHVPVNVNDGITNSNIFDLQVQINRRPVLSQVSLHTNEDEPLGLQPQSFTAAFTDADGNTLVKIKFTTLPKHGSIKLNGNAVNANDEILSASISNLGYTPNSNYNGKDTLSWNASDGFGYGKIDAIINFVINPINDPPIISNLEFDSLQYEVGRDPIQLTRIFSAEDADGDSLTRAEIGFRRLNYETGSDVLEFTNTAHISGSFDGQAGILTLSGNAAIAEYDTAIRAILYKYTNNDNPKLTTKSVYITLSDGKLLSETKDRYISLIYTFQTLQIVNGFTPNGDDVNEKWQIINSNQEKDLQESIITVYNKNGQLVFKSKGFEKKWDAKYNGELVPAGSYIYTIEAIDSKLKSLKKVYKGVVTVMY